MQLFAGASIGFLIIVSIVVAVRLLLLHRRTGDWPELLLGTMLAAVVGVGYPLRIATTQAPDWSVACVIVSDLAIAIGFTLLYVFTWRVFRPDSTVARTFAVAASTVLFLHWIFGSVRVLDHGVADVTNVPMTDIVSQIGTVAVAYVWTAIESLRYYGAMRRRAKLGLADAVVTNRFLLWGIMAVGATCGVALNGIGAALHIDTMRNPAILLASSCTGLVQTVFLLLAFLPPRAYLDWVRSRSAAPSA